MYSSSKMQCNNVKIVVTYILLLLHYSCTDKIKNWQEIFNDGLEYDDMERTRKNEINTIREPHTKKSAILPFFDVTQSHTCSCGMEYNLMDLGPAYFPRYIPTGECKQGTCGRLRECLERQYKVRVLKQKDANTDITPEIHIPKSIKDYWTVEVVTVTVGCVCHNVN